MWGAGSPKPFSEATVKGQKDFRSVSLSRSGLGAPHLRLQQVPPVGGGFRVWGPSSFPWAVVISQKAAGSCLLFANTIRLSSLLTLAVSHPANRMYDAGLRN